MKEITATQLKSMQDAGIQYQLIDIREIYERDAAHIGGIHIPMAEIINKVNLITKTEKVIIYCRSGNRSAVIVQLLERRFGYQNVYNLKGGILAYAEEVDESLIVY